MSSSCILMIKTRDPDTFYLSFCDNDLGRGGAGGTNHLPMLQNKYYKQLLNKDL